MPTELTSHEHSLLDRAVVFSQGVKAANDRLPTQEELRRNLACSQHSAGLLRRYLSQNDIAALADKATARHAGHVARAIAGQAVDQPYLDNEEYLIRENARLNRNLEKLRRESNASRRVQRVLAANHAGYDDLLANIKKFVDALGDISIPVQAVKAATQLKVPPVREGHTEDAVLVCSDHHQGDVVRREDTSGFPEFDLVIGGNRWGYIVKQAKQILSLHRAVYPIKRLYIPILGDMANGELHGSRDGNALFLPGQVHFAYHMMKFGIEDLLTLVDEGTIEEIVLLFSVGNHTRLDLHMPIKHQAQRTMDWLIYQFLIERFRADKRVTIRETMSPFIFENIRNSRYCFTHGYGVGYKNSPDVQAKSISQFVALVRGLFDSPEFRKKNGIAGETFSRIVIGDIHVPTSFPRLLSNGSLNGQNELGVNWGLEPIPAGQWLFGVSDKHQQTWQYFLDCSHIQRENPNAYAQFAAEYAERLGR